MRLSPEDKEQVEVVKYLELLKRQKKILEYFAIVNENKQSSTNKLMAIKLGQKSKMMGKKKGVSDLCIIFHNKTLYIEMKKPKKVLKSGETSKAKNGATNEQLDFINTVTKNSNIFGNVCEGFSEAKNLIDKHLN